MRLDMLDSIAKRVVYLAKRAVNETLGSNSLNNPLSFFGRLSFVITRPCAWPLSPLIENVNYTLK